LVKPSFQCRIEFQVLNFRVNFGIHDIKIYRVIGTYLYYSYPGLEEMWLPARQCARKLLHGQQLYSPGLASQPSMFSPIFDNLPLAGKVYHT
jgi:hypothetical protein